MIINLGDTWRVMRGTTELMAVRYLNEVNAIAEHVTHYGVFTGEQGLAIVGQSDRDPLAKGSSERYPLANETAFVIPGDRGLTILGASLVASVSNLYDPGDWTGLFYGLPNQAEVIDSRTGASYTRLLGRAAGPRLTHYHLPPGLEQQPWIPSWPLVIVALRGHAVIKTERGHIPLAYGQAWATDASQMAHALATDCDALDVIVFRLAHPGMFFLDPFQF